MEREMKCDNCGWEGDYTADAHPARDLHRRLDIGGIFTDVECPDCGALAYPIVSEHQQEIEQLEQISISRLDALKLCWGQLSLYVADGEQSPEDKVALDAACRVLDPEK